MPAIRSRYRSRKTTMRKPYRKRYSTRRSYRRRAIIPRAIPSQRLVKLVYDDVFYLNSGALVPAINTFNLNGIYDPDQTGVGGSPTGASSWATMFCKYKVLGVKVQTHWVANCNQNLIVGFHAYAADSNNYTTPASGTAVQQVLTEMPNSAYKLIGPANLASASAECNLSRYYSMRRLLGSYAYKDSSSAAEVNANPATIARLDVMLTDSLTATAGNVAYCNVRLTYYVRYFEPDLAYTD